MRAAIKFEQQIHEDIQQKLDAYESGMGNSSASDVWQFNFDSFIFRVDFSFFDSLSDQSSEYLVSNQIDIKIFAKLLLLEVFSKQLSHSTFKNGVDFLFMFLHFIISDGCKKVSLDLLRQFLEHYLMHSFNSGKIVARLSPRNYRTASSCMNRLVEVDSLIGYYGLSKLFEDDLNTFKIETSLKTSLEVISAGELPFGDWKKGGTFNHLTLDYGRYYIDYCMRFYKDHYGTALGIATVISNMERHILNVGLTLHKNTKQLFYSLLDSDDITDSKKFKRFKKEKIERLKASIEDEFLNVVRDAQKRSYLLSKSGVNSVASYLGIEQEGEREDKRAQYLSELERLRQIIYLHLEENKGMVQKLLSESKCPVSFEKFVFAIDKTASSTQYSLVFPNSEFYQYAGRADSNNGQPLSLTFLSKVRSAGISVVVSLCGWRGGEFGFPVTSISRKINEDILDQYSTPLRYIVDWHAFKTDGNAITHREITPTAYELISELSLLNQSGEDEPALYPVHVHAKDPTSSSASHSAIKSAVEKNWENFVFRNQDFKILDEVKELEKLSVLVRQRKVLATEQSQRLKELNEKSRTEAFERVIQDPNLIEAKRKAEEQYERVMFITSKARGFYVNGWLVKYKDYLKGLPSELSENMIKVLDTNLSRETKFEIRNASRDACVNNTFISQVTDEVMEGCLYPTPHAFRHMWAEAVYRRFDGDAGWMIRSNFKHVSKNMWLAYIRDKDNRRMHDTIKVRVASSIMKNWLAKEGRDSAGKFHKFLRKLATNTTISNIEGLESSIEKLAREDIISIKANPWGFCVARASTLKMTKCYDGFDYNPQAASPSLCIDCINNLTMSSNIDYIIINSWQHVDLLMSEHISAIPKTLLKQSLDYVRLALKRVSELKPDHSIIPKLKLAVSNGGNHGLL